MTFEETKQMIQFLREEGAIQVTVGAVSATFADVKQNDKVMEVIPEADPEAVQIIAEHEKLDAYAQKRFGYKLNDILGG